MFKFYRAFEEKFRGTKNSVKDKLKIYLPLIKKEKKIIDIGCGRGEFLELLYENGYKNLIGVDINSEMLNAIKYNSIKLFIEDGLEFLKKQENESAGIITSFHMIEHIPFEKVLEFIKEAFRVLDNDGILILETPNPENLKVATENFYLDYTHIRPIPMELLKFTFEYVGFNARILRLNSDKIGNSIKDVIEKVSPDYAVIGFKNKEMIDAKFFKKGVSLDLAMFAFEERIKNLEERMKNMELKVENQNLKIEIDKLKNQNENLKIENDKLKNQNENLKVENDKLKNQNENLIKLYEDIINSKSWRVTKPLRVLMNFLNRKKREKILQITVEEKNSLNLSPRAKEIYNKLKEEIKK